MRFASRWFGAVVAFFLVAIVSAEGGLLKLTANPSASVADGRSTVTVTAEVWDSSGSLVKDGVPVVFSASLGSFREDSVTVYGGKARAVLVASPVAGVSKITASALSVGAVGTLEFEFVSDRSLLAAAREYAEMRSPGGIRYNVDLRTLSAGAPDRGVYFRFRDVEVHADDLQYDVASYLVRARKAKVRIGKTEVMADEAVIRLMNRKAFVTTSFTGEDRIPWPKGRAFSVETREKTRYGVAEVLSTGVREPTESVSAELFRFEDQSVATSMVEAESVIVFPKKELQFQRAEVYVAETRVMKVPLYQLSVYSPVLVTEQFFNVNNNQISINYPHYLSLKPGQSSLLRFRTGETYGRSFSANKGVFLDYEMGWTNGDKAEGGLIVSGIARSDWGIQVHQNYRPDDATYGFLQADLTEGRSLFGSLALSRQFSGFQASMTANSTTAIRGNPYTNRYLSVSAEKDPMKVRGLPVRLYFGVTGSQSEAETPSGNYSQTVAGLRARMQMVPQRVDAMTTAAASMSLSALSGRSSGNGMGVEATVAMTRQITTGSSLMLTYNFNDDAFSSRVLGRHRISAQGVYGTGRLRFNGYLSQSLDLDRTNYLVDSSYRISDLWRLTGYYTEDRYFGESYSDLNLVLSYRLGLRDFGLVYSGTTNRFGIQVLGASFN